MSETQLTVDVTLFDLLYLCGNARQDEIMQYEALVGPWSADAAANAFWMNPGPKYVLVDREGPVVAGGWIPIVTGVYQSWMVGREGGWETHWRTITKASRRIMQYMVGPEGYARRLQTSALANRTKACEWYERGLKMQYEGTFKNFGFNGEDMVNYALTREVHDGQ